MSTELEREAIKRVEQRLDDLFELVGDVRERLAHMEGRATHSAVDALKNDLAAAQARIAVLEASHNIRNGQLQASKTWGEWLHRLAPWVFAVALVAWNYIKPPVG